ncbi:MAG: TolC family protein [Kiritimatiellae bacterium]|nr:TolC family protein [Kiritimatiellia bacterium]
MIKNILTIVFSAVFCLVAGDSPAEEISAGQIVNEVLEHSYRLKIAGEQVTAAEAVKKQAAAAAFPSLDLDGRAAHYWGLHENTLGNFRIPAIPDRYGGGVMFSQPLYTGGKISGGKQMADAERLSARASFAARRADIVYQALVAYWSWAKAFYAAESFRASTAWMEAHERDMRNLRGAGLATENERLSTSVRLDQTRLRLEEALRYTLLCRAGIERLTGKTLPEAAFPVRPSCENQVSAGGEENLIQGALANRPDVRAMQFALNAARKNIQIQSAGYFPQLNANLRGEVARPNPLNIPPEDEWQFDAFAGISVSWNILDWGLTRAKANEARARANQAGYQLSQLNEQIAFEVRQALINLQNAVTKARVSAHAEESAQLDLKAAADLWQNGLARHSDVLDAQARLTDAGFDQIAAAADIALARAELEHACGIAEAEAVERQNERD